MSRGGFEIVGSSVFLTGAKAGCSTAVLPAETNSGRSVGRTDIPGLGDPELTITVAPFLTCFVFPSLWLPYPQLH